MRVLVMSSYTKSLFWFRMDLMDELVAAGHEVFALGSDDSERCRTEFRSHGIEYRSFRVSRNGLSPIEDLRTYLGLRAAIAEIAPGKVFVYQAKTIVYGCPAAKRAGVPEVYPLVAGLGSIFRSGGLKNRIIQSILKIQYKSAFSASDKVFLQNEDDRSELVSLGLLPYSKTIILNGSGVNLERFTAQPLPTEPVFLFLGRLIADKGIVEYLNACREIRRRDPRVRCLVVGPYDTNPSALKPSDIEDYVSDGTVEYFGEQGDVRPYLAQCSVFVLPSYHEGTPKSVLEAMATGRPIITTDAPGCRETVVDGENGFLVAVGSVSALVERMEAFVVDPSLMRRMGEASRRIAQEKYDVRKVNAVIREVMGLGLVKTTDDGVSDEAREECRWIT